MEAGDTWKKYCGALVAAHISAAYGTVTTNAWPPKNLMDEIIGLAVSDLMSGGYAGKTNIIPVDQAERMRKSIAAVSNNMDRIAFVGKAPTVPISRARLKANERQARYRQRVAWYPYYGITPEMDDVLYKLDGDLRVLNIVSGVR